MRSAMRLAWMSALVLAGCGGGGAGPYTSQEGNFRVDLSGTPKTTSRTDKTPAGPLTTHTTLLEDRDKFSRSVTYSEFPTGLLQGKDANTLLDAGMRGMGQAWLLGGQVPVAIDGHPGREASFEVVGVGNDENGAGRARCYIIGPRMYQVVIIGPKSKMNDALAKAFLDSFKLLKPVAPVVKATPAPAVVAQAAPPSPPKPRDPPSQPPPSADRSRPASTPPAPSRPSEKPPADSGESSAAGASIASFEWVDDKEDVVGGHGDAAKPDGTKDQHFRLTLDLPDDAVVEQMTITSGGFHKWVTKPAPGLWAIAIHRDGQPLTKAHVQTVGKLPGKSTLDLYANTGIGIGPNTAFELKVVVTTGGAAHTLTSRCKRP